ncbi:putative laccase-9 [Prosopis cineraria]|uniref:putative laccase-9 n=1 Tax=Prosopis cineraria TaxID=364024 RepID=UPI0024106DEF|nr:putative laccase-9 [Prosopis cineraria]
MNLGKEMSVILVILGVLLCKAQGAVHHHDFVLQEKNFTKLCSTKSILTVNGSFPGPTITAHKGDIVFVTVHNHGTYGVTIHWHGVRQPNDPWSDGPENITQCPIPPGTNFTQRINLAYEEGTLWWHAHSDWTRATVHGAIVIHPPHGSSYPFTEPYGQETLIIGEWYKGDVMTIIDDALATGGEPNTSDAFTINGQPGDLYACSNGTTHRFSVVQGKTYLLRIISAAMNEAHYFGITNHSLTVVGIDAAYVKPFTTPYLVITPGQTMDVLLQANQTPGLYYIVASSFQDGSSPYDNTTTTAILQYSGSSNASQHPPMAFPDFPEHNDSTAPFNFTNRLRGLGSESHPIEVPKTVNRMIYMTVAVNVLACNASTCDSTTKLAASLNNVSFQTPSIDILDAYYWNKTGVFTKDFPKEPPNYINFTDPDNNAFTTTGTRVIMLNYNDSVEVVWQGTNNSLNTAENHPMHLHGFSYYVVGQGWGVFNNKTDPESYNLVDPPEVNTVSLPMNGWLAMRFVANNPGVWFMHCHFERHSSWGMDTVLIVKDGKTNETRMLPPPKYMPPCSK